MIPALEGADWGNYIGSSVCTFYFFKHLYELWKAKQQHQSFNFATKIPFFNPKSLDHGLVNCFCKRLDSKYFQCYRPPGLSMWERRHRQYANKPAWFCCNKTYLWALKYEFHVIFTHHKICSLIKLYCDKL